MPAQGGEEVGIDQGGPEELEGVRVGGQEKNLGANHREPPVTSASRYQEATARHALLMSANCRGAYTLVGVTNTIARLLVCQAM